MKCRFTGLLLILAMATQAQTKTTPASTSKWHYGIKMDWNLSGINGNGMQSSLASGIEGGVFAEYALHKNWGLQPEILVNQSNYKKASDFTVYYNNDGQPYANDNVKLTYVTIPVLVRYNLNPAVTFLAGPQYSYLTYDNEDLRLNGQPAFKKSEIGADIGAQLNLSLFSFYVRYSKGLNNINNIDDRYKWTSQHLMFGLEARIK